MTTQADPNRLILWDIDHTLIDTGGVGKRLYVRAFEAVSGKSMEHEVDVTGRTELDIFAETAQRHGIESSDDLVDRYRDELARQYQEHVHELSTKGHRLPGAVQALAALATMPKVVQTVLTGNLRAVAAVKLQAFGLHQYIDWTVGAYGDDDGYRPTLVVVAQRRAAEKYGVRFERHNTVIVGDSASDVAAARDGGAMVIAVTSGRDDEQSLRSAGADTVLGSLADTHEFLSTLGQTLS